MTDDNETFAYTEGYNAFHLGIIITHNPYDGVMDKLRNAWEEGWFAAFDSEQE